MPGKRPITFTQGLALLAVLAGLVACGRDDPDASDRGSAAPEDPFVGDYYEGGDPTLRITRSGQRYEATAIHEDYDGPGRPVPEEECDDGTLGLLEQAREYDPVAICFPASPGMPKFSIVHTRATSNAPLLETRTGYAAYIRGAPGELRRQAPAAASGAQAPAAGPAPEGEPALAGVYRRQYREISAALDAAWWDELEFLPDGTVRATGPDAFESPYSIVDDVLKPEGSFFTFDIHPDGCLVLAGNVRYCRDY